MATSQRIILPILPRSDRPASKRVAKGSLASAGDSAARTVSSKLQGVTLDQATLKNSLEAAITLADHVSARATSPP